MQSCVVQLPSKGCHHTCAGGLGMWMREKASMTGRRWRRALWGRKSLKSFLHSEASPALLPAARRHVCERASISLTGWSDITLPCQAASAALYPPGHRSELAGWQSCARSALGLHAAVVKQSTRAGAFIARIATRIAHSGCSVETIWRTMLRLSGRSCTTGRRRVSTRTF